MNTFNNTQDLTLSNITKKSQDFFKNIEESKKSHNELQFKRSWIYNKKCSVVDFQAGDFVFAFNIYPLNQDKVKVELLQRKSATNFRLNNAFLTHICILNSSSITAAFSRILEVCEDVLVMKSKFMTTGKNEPFKIISNDVVTKPLKIGVLTLPMNKNYGGNLQAYAMLEVINKLGHEAIFINRRFPHANAKNSIHMTSKTVGLPPRLENRKFLDKNFNVITKPFFSSQQLNKDIINYDLDGVIVGSDQVWRPKYANSILDDFFLGFIPENSPIRKISYAASFGSDEWEYSKEEQQIAAKRLAQFTAIGVREDKAVDMCKEHFKVDSTHVLDPTMLLTAQHYSEKFALKKLRRDEDYLLNYVLDINDDKENTIKQLSNELGLEAHSVNGKPFERVNALKSSDGDQSVEGWLAAFFKAKFIVTDSFHGVAFSILFNKPFLAYANPARGMARFTSLLNMFDLKSRLVINSSQVTMDTMTSDIEWDAVNSKLQKMRSHSIHFLLNSFGLPTDKIESTLLSLGYLNGNPHSVSENPQKTSTTPKKEIEVKKYHADFSEKIKVREFPLKAEKVPFTISNVVSSGMCIGCGACSYVTKGKVQVLPNNLGLESVTKEGLEKLSTAELNTASTVCPFSDNSLNEDQLDAPYSKSEALPFNEVIGRYSSLFSGRQVGDDKLMGSSSGGLTSWLIKKLLAKDMIDAVIHVGKASSDGNLFEYRISSTQDELNENRKSNYYPTTLASVFEKIKENPTVRYAIVGVPCFIKAARLLSEKDEILNNALKFYVGLVCGHMKSKFFAESNAWQLGVSPSEIESVDFRKKMPNKKVGQYHFSVQSSAQKEYSAQPTSLIGGSWGHAFFQPNACNYCDDIFAETADIVFGDAWLPKFNDEWRGTNIVVSRNPELTSLFEEGANLKEVILDDLSVDEAIQTQFGGISHRRHGLTVRVKDDEVNGENYPSKRMNPDKINLPFWRVELFRQRKKMSKMSSEVFYEAKKAGNLDHFKLKMISEVAIYRYIESLKNKKTW